MIESVTPKGVEHASSLEIAIHMIRVIESVTPKGVEHRTLPAGTAAAHFVIESVTPKGVEHKGSVVFWDVSPR